MSFFRKSINGQTCTFTGEKQLVLQREDVDLRHNNRAVIFFMGAYDKKKKINNMDVSVSEHYVI